MLLRYASRLPVILIGVFSLTTWALIPFGSLIAGLFDQHERIPAYTVNITGSLAGVLAFTAVSGWGLPSVAWFVAGIGLLGLHAQRRAVLIGGLFIVASLSAVFWVDSNRTESTVLWSPYNQLRIRPLADDVDDGFVIDVNNQFLLSGLDLRPGAEDSDALASRYDDDITNLRTYYDFPFQIAEPESVLVLGAGAGNEIAAALRADVRRVTAVEIDARVAQYGEDHHPEQPHRSDRVEVVVDDARSYLKSSDDTFDLVLFATLDAHGLVSSSSSVCLDSFVYTTESLEEAARLLSDDGVLVLSFGPFREEVQLRQYAMMEEVFGTPPDYYLHVNDHRMLVAGALGDAPDLPAGWSAIDRDEVLAGFEVYPSARIPATDDWPHLYIRKPAVSFEYVVSLIGMAIVGLVLVVRIRCRIGGGSAQASDIPFFFLGAAFLLMETKSVTEFALLIGSTWQTNALVFSVILSIILLANLWVHRGRGGAPRMWFAVIGASLLAHYFWPVSAWPEIGNLELVAAGFYLGIPIFGAAIVFARWFSSSAVGSVALGINLLGAVVGGALEYSSLLIGIRALALVALVLYGLALVTYEFGGKVKVSVGVGLPT